MKVHQLSKKLKISNKELLAQMDDPRVTSHLSKVPEDILAQFDVEEKKIETGEKSTETIDSAQTIVVGDKDEDENESHENSLDATEESTIVPDVVVVETDKDVGNSSGIREQGTCPVDKETLKVSLRGLGSKSPYFKWKHILDG